MSPWPRLAGRLCVLRALEPADAPSIQRYADDAAVARYLVDGFPQPYTMAHAQAWCGGQWRDPAFGWVWALEVAGEAVGCVAVVPQAGPLRCNGIVGYWLGRAFWRRGIAHEALSLLTAWVWAQRPEITRLYAPIFSDNMASQGLAAKCGYVREAVQPQSVVKDGRVIDCVIYACYRQPPVADASAA